MKTPSRASSIVLLGNWNPFILNPQWVGKYIFRQREIEAELLLAPTPAFRLSAGGVTIVPAQDKVTIIAEISDKGSLEKIEKFAQTLLNELPYTPIHSIGINHAFDEDAPSEDVLCLFKHPDESNFPDGMPVEFTELGRRLAGNGYKLNFRASMDRSLEAVHFHFNFHYPINGNQKEMGRSIISNERVCEHFEFAKGFIADQYGLEFREDREMEESDGSTD